MSLFEAIKKDDESKIDELLKHGINTKEVDQYGDTVLHYAARADNIDVVRKLVDEFDVIVDAQNRWNESALSIAVARENYDIAEILLESGANPNLADNEGHTSLHEAGLKNDIEMMELLVKHGGDISAVSKYGNTVLHCVAIGVTQYSEDWDLVIWLIDQKARYDQENSIGKNVYDMFYEIEWSYAERFEEILMSKSDS